MSTLFSNIFARFHILTFSDSTLSGFDASISFPNFQIRMSFLDAAVNKQPLEAAVPE